MARVNMSIPDDVIARARAAGLNVSRVATSAIEDALEKEVKRAELRAYLAELEAEHGPTSELEREAARRWVDDLEAVDQALRSGTERRA